MQATVERPVRTSTKNLAKLVSFPSQSSVYSLYEHILIFLNGKSQKSKNTARKFERDIRDFFRATTKKEIEQLTTQDLKVKNVDVIKYRNNLVKEGKYKNSTINGKLTAVVSLYKFLKANDYDVNVHAISLVDKLPDDTKHIGNLTPDEVHCLADLASNEKFDPLMKRALIYTAYATSTRIGALLKLKLKHFRQDEENPKKYIIEPNHLDKSKIINKEIHVSVYQLIIDSMLIQDEDALIFNISPTGALNMLKRLCKKAGFDSKRNLAFHSIRKAGADFANEYSNGDLFIVTKQGNWSNPQTVSESYLSPVRNITGMAAFEEIHDDVFDKLSREDAIQLLKSVSKHSGTGVRLREEAQELIKQNN